MDARGRVTSAIKSIAPHDEIEAEHRRDALAWIDSGAGLFRVAKPDMPPKHLVSYFVPIDQKQCKMLLVHHKKANLWLPAGGHVEVDEDPHETAARECREELGIDAKFLHDTPQFITVTRTVNTDRPHTDVSLWYVLEGDESQVLDWDSGEFYDIRWWPIDEIITTPVTEFDPHMQRFVAKCEAS